MTFRKPLIAGNWKMNKSCTESVNYARSLVDRVSQIKNVDIFIAPAFTSLFVVANVFKNTNVSLAAQNIFWRKNGAFTGEISVEMLKDNDVACEYVIIGHSERRHFFFETDEVINKKIKIALTSNICPVLCVGETKMDRQQGKTFSVIDKQIRVGLKDVSFNEMKQIVLAYEPVWAIGTGDAASENQAQEIHSFIRSFLGQLYSCDLAEVVRIIYGGSVNLGNIEKIMTMPDIDGALIGGASLEPEVFAELIHLGDRSVLAGRD